jgi:hypothetical protein
MALLAAAASALLLALAGSASAKVLDSYCSPTGDYCTSVIQKHSRVKLHFGAFNFRGRYRVCVRGPHRTRVCHRSKLRRHPHGVYADQIDWARRFPHRTHGHYHVSWFKHGKVGPTLKFVWKGH